MPYPAETEIIANVVTSPHQLSATMVTGRVHRMTELFGRLAPGATIETARAELIRYMERWSRNIRQIIPTRQVSYQRGKAARPDHFGRENRFVGIAGGVRTCLHHCLPERRKLNSSSHSAT